VHRASGPGTFAGMRLLVADDPSFDAHRAPRRHPECPERLEAARSGLARAGVQIEPLAPRRAEPHELGWVHEQGHLQAVGRALEHASASGAHGALDADTFVGPGTREACLRAAGASVEIGERLARGEARRAFALLRPPGHHAEPSRAMGFCLFNNVALAAASALRTGARRVAIVDWDVHHGNGTQQAFESDPRVLFVSLHQWPLYPGTGAPGEIGLGAAAGTNANLALPPGSGPEEYGDAFRRAVLPLVLGFAPDLVLVSAGYDAHEADPLASMQLDAASYGGMASALVQAAEELGHGRVGFFLEGGYDLRALESSVTETALAAMGAPRPLPDGPAAPGARASVDATLRALGRPL